MNISNIIFGRRPKMMFGMACSLVSAKIQLTPVVLTFPPLSISERERVGSKIHKINWNLPVAKYRDIFKSKTVSSWSGHF